MTLLVRGITVSSFAILLAITGCSASDQKPMPKEGCVAQQCDGAEPKEIMCDEGAVSITDPQSVRTDNLEGVLEIRKATKSGCHRLYWTRYDPAEGSAGAWQLRQERNGESTKIQRSEDNRPQLEGWTVVFYADEDDKLVGCVVDTGSLQEVCTPTISPR